MPPKSYVSYSVFSISIGLILILKISKEFKTSKLTPNLQTLSKTSKLSIVLHNSLSIVQSMGGYVHFKAIVDNR